MVHTIRVLKKSKKATRTSFRNKVEKLVNELHSRNKVIDSSKNKVSNKFFINEGKIWKKPIFSNPSDKNLIIKESNEKIKEALMVIEENIKLQDNIINEEKIFKNIYDKMSGDSLKTITQIQERLLILQHATFCENSNCKLIYCAQAKENSKHSLKCNNQKCNVKHCISSRYLLDHYLKCDDDKCPKCVPVKTFIKSKNVDKFIKNNQELPYFGTFKK